ncbi:hypothetical protein BGK67_01100 [Streptomyces subrutilus]|uniref:Uncharacterized protein n=1 Tax=Streptomyces subrutilus TaxID=36818 RepID=A0A1E5PL29_9ACTN|nr:hypothetical protein BGK67_01100 [Streptomyces subrutilus]
MPGEFEGGREQDHGQYGNEHRVREPLELQPGQHGAGDRAADRDQSEATTTSRPGAPSMPHA